MIHKHEIPILEFDDNPQAVIMLPRSIRSMLWSTKERRSAWPRRQLDLHLLPNSWIG